MNYDILPWIVLGGSLIVTTLIWVTIIDLDKQAQELEFNSLIEGMIKQIQGKFQTHEQVLMGFQGLFSSSVEVTQDEFANFFSIQKIPDRFPDIQGVGFIKYVPNEKAKEDFKKKLDDFGLDFSIKPNGTRSKYYPVMFLEPQDFRNIRALGYDVYSEEIRRQAVDEATNSGQTTLTGKIILVQETGQDVQNGFLMLLPVFENNNENGNSIQLQGLVYSVFRMNDFIEGIWGKEIFNHLNVKIYDGVPNSENLFFDSENINSKLEEGGFSYSKRLEFGSREWTFFFTGVNPSIQTTQENRLVIPIIGYSVSFVLFYAFSVFLKNIKLTKTMIKKEKTSALGELASRFAHDVRNPLSNINMALNLIKKDKGIFADKKTEERLEIISKNVKRISHQVDDVLDFIRIHPLKKEKISLKSLIEESVEGIQIPKQIKIERPQNEVFLFGDLFQLQTVFKNLIINAIHAIGGKEGKITISGKENSENTIIEIEDSGTGFSGIDKNEIFELFSTTKQTGTGLGLVSCKQIVENHGGNILVKENPTRFTIKLPRK